MGHRSTASLEFCYAERYQKLKIKATAKMKSIVSIATVLKSTLANNARSLASGHEHDRIAHA
ncbi:hypothetical protein CBM2623_A170041 [Cupriavidus taiwanensis]|nr:hypothetical protein CBM2623_A170041 [Cupriavidus taiwanensis]